MTVSKIRVGGTDHDIRAKYLVPSSEATPTEHTISSMSTSGVSQDMGEGIATISKIKGNTIKWNQIIKNGNFANGTANWNSDSTMSVSNGVMTVTAGSGNTCIYQDVSVTSGHKYYVSFIINSSESSYIGYFATPTQWFGTLGTQNLNKDYRFSVVITADSNKTRAFFGKYNTTSGHSYTLSNIWIVDLTNIYGAGNEPTVEQFEAQYPASYYTYDAGSLYGTTIQSIKSVGFNQFDESTWQYGKYRQPTGAEQDFSGRRRSDVYFPCLPNTTYYRYSSSNDSWDIIVCWYDSNKNYISGTNGINSTITAPSNAAYFRLSSANAESNICINISDASRNGTYEPYKQSICPLNIASLKGKLNGAGSSVTIFPNGVHKNGTTYDELTATTAVKKIADDNTVLSSPQTYILDTPLNLSYASFYGGTESILPEQTSTITSAPLDAIISYSAGDVQALMGSQAANISNDSLKNLLDAIVTAGVISTYTMVYNADTGKYDFTITN